MRTYHWQQRYVFLFLEIAVSFSFAMDRFVRSILRKLGRVVFAILILVAIAVLAMAMGGYRLGVDAQRLVGAPACMPSLFYLWSRTHGAVIKKGDYAVALMPKTEFGLGAREGDRIIKIVMGAPGDKVKIQGTEVWINGRHIDRLWLAKSLPGKTVGDYDVDFELGPRQYFLMGTERESFDSRYWGPVKREAIIGTAIPLL